MVLRPSTPSFRYSIKLLWSAQKRWRKWCIPKYSYTVEKWIRHWRSPLKNLRAYRFCINLRLLKIFKRKLGRVYYRCRNLNDYNFSFKTTFLFQHECQSFYARISHVAIIIFIVHKMCILSNFSSKLLKYCLLWIFLSDYWLHI